MPILIIVQITLGQSTNLRGARMMAIAQTGTETPVVINNNTIASDGRHDEEPEG